MVVFHPVPSAHPPNGIVTMDPTEAGFKSPVVVAILERGQQNITILTNGSGWTSGNLLRYWLSLLRVGKISANG